MDPNMDPRDRKAVVLGLDGATWDVLLPRAERGQMPNLNTLLEQGVWGGLQSTVPPFSAQAWVSMVTGKNQARHGVVDFWEPTPNRDRRSFVTARQVHGETLWQIVGRHGMRVGITNVPVTYPPSEVHGYLVSGLLTPQGRDDYVFPPWLKAEILGLVPGYNPDPFDPVGASKRQVLELEAWMQKHEQVTRSLMESYPSSLCFSVVQALDHLQHLFWNEIAAGSAAVGFEEAERSEFSALVDRCYAFADQIIGHRLATSAAQQANLFLVSDHGFGPARKWFHVNRLLQERGLLSLGAAQGGRLSRSLAGIGLTPQRMRDLVRRADVLGLRRHMGRLARVALGRQIDNALALPVDWSRTKAISGSPATEGVFVNLKGREPEGIVEPGEPYEAVREQLVAELRGLYDPDTGEPVIYAAYRREEIYAGPFLDLLPDVVFDLGDGPYLASDAPAAGQIIEPLPDGTLEGRHRSRGVFAAYGPDIHRGAEIKGARIIDIAPTLLYALGLPIPEDMDGRPLVEIFGEDFRSSHPVSYAEPQEVGAASPPVEYDEEDTAEMERRLRGLGYVS